VRAKERDVQTLHNVCAPVTAALLYFLQISTRVKLGVSRVCGTQKGLFLLLLEATAASDQRRRHRLPDAREIFAVAARVIFSLLSLSLSLSIGKWVGKQAAAVDQPASCNSRPSQPQLK
jgi:hypothetical protein